MFQFLSPLGRIPQWWEEYRGTPYVAEFSADDGFDPGTIKVDAFKGLLYAQVIVGATGCRILTFWEGEAAYAAVVALFRQQTGLAAATWTGTHRGLQAHRPGFLRRHWTLILLVLGGVATVWGNLEKVGEAWAWLFAPAVAHAAAADTAPLNVLVNDRFEVEFAISNISGQGLCDARLSQPTFAAVGNYSATGLRLDPVVTTDLVGIKSGERKTLKAAGEAVAPGEYLVAVKGVSVAGLLGRSANLAGQRQVVVWPERAVHLVRVKRSDTQSCDMVGELLVGRSFATGLECSALLVLVPEVKFAAVDFRDLVQQELFTNPAPGAEATSLRWRTPPLAPWRKIPFTLVLQSTKQRTPEQWAALLPKIEFSLDPRGN